MTAWDTTGDVQALPIVQPAPTAPGADIAEAAEPAASAAEILQAEVHLPKLTKKVSLKNTKLQSLIPLQKKHQKSPES
jgi:hypothetical protein